MPGPSNGRFAGSTCQPSSVRKLYVCPFATDSAVKETLKSKLKSLGADDAHGKLQSMRSRYASSLSSGAREMAVNATSWFWRWRCVWLKPSATPEQLGHPSSQCGAYMKWYTINCDRPRNRSVKVAGPSSV